MHELARLTTLYNGPEAQVTGRADAVHHEDEVIHLVWLT